MLNWPSSLGQAGPASWQLRASGNSTAVKSCVRPTVAGTPKFSTVICPGVLPTPGAVEAIRCNLAIVGKESKVTLIHCGSSTPLKGFFTRVSEQCLLAAAGSLPCFAPSSIVLSKNKRAKRPLSTLGGDSCRIRDGVKQNSWQGIDPGYHNQIHTYSSR